MQRPGRTRILAAGEWKDGRRERASYIAARIGSLVPGIGWHRYRLIAVPREGMPAMPRGYDVRAVDAASLAGRTDAPRTALDWRAGQGMTALAAFRDTRLDGVIWVTDKAFREDEVDVIWSPPDGGIWDTGLWIDPARRLSRAFAALWAGVANWMAARGADWSFSRIADYNRASLAPHLRLGARSIGTAAFARLGPWQLSRQDSGPLCFDPCPQMMLRRPG
ncbi:MAG: hypothetical protein AAGD40_00790 [Pseudomonadota bacterium]